MKRNNLTTAVVAGIAGIAGIASVSNAVNLNSDGVGQVLVYPYYTVNNNLNTLISVVNTTAETKAVKVRFLEGKNSRECLDFNLYLSPYDVWTAGLVPHVATAGFVGTFYAGQATTKIVSQDKSCVFPDAIRGSGTEPNDPLGSYEFLPFGFDPGGDGSTALGYDRGGRDLARCTEGHFEMIEMGVLESNSDISSVKHNAAGTPNCGAIASNWTVGTGKWFLNNNQDIGAPTGGLFGSASIIDIGTGVDVSYNADAIQSFGISPNQTDPGSITPSLSSGGNFTSNIFDNGAVVTDTWNTSSVQAVSALYMHDNVYGEYVLTDGIGANTEWVVTFPTKYAYVDTFKADFGAASNYPFEPFTQSFQGGVAGTACEEYNFGYWDREEQIPGVDVGPQLPSPLPPGITAVTPQFCWESNILEIHDEAITPEIAALASSILGSSLNTHVATQATTDPTFFDTGWIALTFTQSTNDNFRFVNYGGLPVTGFAIQRYVNASDPSGAKNYAGLFKHRYARNIVSS